MYFRPEGGTPAAGSDGGRGTDLREWGMLPEGHGATSAAEEHRHTIRGMKVGGFCEGVGGSKRVDLRAVFLRERAV